LLTQKRTTTPRLVTVAVHPSRSSFWNDKKLHELATAMVNAVFKKKFSRHLLIASRARQKKQQPSCSTDRKPQSILPQAIQELTQNGGAKYVKEPLSSRKIILAEGAPIP